MTYGSGRHSRQSELPHKLGLPGWLLGFVTVWRVASPQRTQHRPVSLVLLKPPRVWQHFAHSCRCFHPACCNVDTPPWACNRDSVLWVCCCFVVAVAAALGQSVGTGRRMLTVRSLTCKATQGVGACVLPGSLWVLSALFLNLLRTQLGDPVLLFLAVCLRPTCCCVLPGTQRNGGLRLDFKSACADCCWGLQDDGARELLSRHTPGTRRQLVLGR